MSPYLATLTLTFVIFVLLFVRRRYQRRKYAWRTWSHNLMTREEYDRILRILAASRNA